MPKIPHVYYDKATGSYYAVASFGFDIVTGKRLQKKKRGFKTQAEAKKWYEDFMCNHSNSAITRNSTMNFSVFLENFFIPDYKRKVSARTFDTLVPKIKRLDYFMDFKLIDIATVHVKKWHVLLFEQGLSNNYIRALHQILQQIFDLAVTLGLLSQNVAKIIGNVKKEPPKVDFWTKEEFEKFINTFDKKSIFEHVKFITFYFFFMTGLRISELQALEWKDINWQEKYVIINKSMYYINHNNWYINRTKTRSSVRLIYLDDVTVELLKNWKSEQQKLGRISFVFSYNGLPLVKSTLKRTLEIHSKIAGIKSIRIHDLRHSHASFLLSLGMNDLEIQNRLGHADINTTLGTYSHLRPNAMKEVAKKLNGTLSLDSSDKYIPKFNGNQYIKKVE